MTQKTMYPTTVGDATTALTTAYVAGTDTAVWVDDSGIFPAAPNTVTIRKIDKSALVTIRYTGKTSSALTGLTVIQADSVEALTATYPIGSDVSKPLTQDDMQVIQDNIRDVVILAEAAATGEELTNHVTDLDNPHNATKDQVGLSNVDNTSDANKPISTAQQAALNGKADMSHADRHKYLGPDAVIIDASQLATGVIDIERIPRAALERVVVVANDAARYALTADDVDKGDVVKVNSTSLMWAVVDVTRLSTDAGYVKYTASADWANITGKPSTYTPGNHADQHASGGGDPIIPASIDAADRNHVHTPSDIGASPENHSHTPAEIGAAASGHTHTPVSIGAADRNHVHTPSDIGASSVGHTHTPDDIGAAARNHTHAAQEVGAAPTLHKSQHATGGSDPLAPADIGASPLNHSHEAENVGAADRVHAGQHSTLGGDPINPISIGAADRVHTHTASDVGAAPAIHKARHAAGGADAIAPADIGAAEEEHNHTPEDIGAAAKDHADRHATNGNDPVTPASIGAAATNHVHSGYANKVHGDQHKAGGNDPLTPGDIGASPTGHTHSEYAVKVHGGSHNANSTDPIFPEGIGAADRTHTHTPDEAGAAPEEHTHTGTDLGPAVDGTSIIVNQSGKLEATAGPQPSAEGVSYDNTSSGLMATTVQDAIDAVAGAAGHQLQADWTQADTTKVDFIKNKPLNMPPTVHKSSHAAGGYDPLSPEDIGAATAGHTHTGFAAIIHADQHKANGSDPLYPTDIGASPSNHTHTPSSIGAAEVNHTHLPADIGAAEEQHNHVANDLVTAIDGATIIKNTSGKLEAKVSVHKTSHTVGGGDALTPVDIGAAAENHNHAGNDISVDGTTIVVNANGQLSATAPAQEQANWSEPDTTDPSYIQNKPSLGTAAAKNVPTSGNATATQVVMGNDTRLSNERSPSSHKSSHVIGGSDALTAGDIGAAVTNHTHTKDQVGLSNVDNTSDANKPISTAQQAALNGKADNSDISDMVHGLQPLQSVSVLATSWSEQNSPDVPDYPFRAAIVYAGITVDHLATVVFGQSEAVSGTFANVCQSVAGSVYIYAKEQPTEQITIKTIAAVKVS